MSFILNKAKINLSLSIMLISSLLLGGCGGSGTSGSNSIASGSLSGMVTDANTKTPLAGVSVTIYGNNIGATTLSNGQYSIPFAPAGSQIITFRKAGYQTKSMTVNISPSQNATLSTSITPFVSTATWTDLSANAPVKASFSGVTDLNGVLFLSSNIATSSTLFQSLDDGVTITPVTGISTQGINALSTSGTLSAWGICGNGTTISTQNGGGTWTQGEVGAVAGGGLQSISFPNQMTGFVAGLNGALASTTDGGVTWTAMPTGVSMDLYAVAFPSVTSGFLAGNGKVILQTTDGGKTWTSVTVNIPSAIHALSAPNSTHVWAVGNGGVILFYNGVQWTYQNSNTTSDLYAVSFCDDNNGWAVGDDGMILHTTDGGTTWLREAPNMTIFPLRGVIAVSPKEAWAVGLYGVIMHYTAP